MHGTVLVLEEIFPYILYRVVTPLLKLAEYFIPQLVQTSPWNLAIGIIVFNQRRKTHTLFMWINNALAFVVARDEFVTTAGHLCKWFRECQ